MEQQKEDATGHLQNFGDNPGCAQYYSRTRLRITVESVEAYWSIPAYLCLFMFVQHI